MLQLKKIVCVLLLLLIIGCQDNQETLIAEFESADTANKVLVMLSDAKINVNIVEIKGIYSIYVTNSQMMSARKLLSKFNFYFEDQSLNDLLESKFSSLSQLENIKGNLLQGREIYNKLNAIPDVLRANVIVMGDKVKRVSVILISIKEFDEENKAKIERFLKGAISENDSLTIEYLF